MNAVMKWVVRVVDILSLLYILSWGEWRVGVEFCSKVRMVSGYGGEEYIPSKPVGLGFLLLPIVARK